MSQSSADDLSRRLSALAERLRDVDPDAELERRRERFLSNRPQLARGTIANRSSPLDVHEGTVVRRRPGSICELVVRDGVLLALLGDRRLELPAWLEPAMTRIAGLGPDEPLTVGALSNEIGNPSARAVLVRRLVREGLLSFLGER